MMKRTLQELNLVDDFLLGSVVNYPGLGEKFSRTLLEIIFEKKIGTLKIEGQKVFYGNDTDKHGARLDLYLEEEAEGTSNATIYDLEPDNMSDTQSKQAVPKRTRYYHSKIDGKCLQSGEGYEKLKDVYVIMFLPYDPFGYDQLVYTVKNQCLEVPKMPYEDGATTIYYYLNGSKGNISKEMKELFAFMQDSTKEKATNEKLEMLYDMVDTVKKDEEVGLGYMKVYEREQLLIRMGQEMEQEKIREAEVLVEKEKAVRAGLVMLKTEHMFLANLDKIIKRTYNIAKK